MELLDRIFLGILIECGKDLGGISLDEKIIDYFKDDFFNYLNSLDIDISEFYENNEFKNDAYRAYIIKLAKDYDLGYYRSGDNTLVLHPTGYQIEDITRDNEDISELVMNAHQLFTKEPYEAFWAHVIEGVDLKSGLMEVGLDRIYHPLYEKSVYEDLYTLVYNYYCIKIDQQTYPNGTKKEKMETEKRLREDKKKLTALANQIVYGYTDLIEYYYYWSKALIRHYNDIAHKKVVVGPGIIEKQLKFCIEEEND